MGEFTQLHWARVLMCRYFADWLVTGSLKSISEVHLTQLAEQKAIQWEHLIKMHSIRGIVKFWISLPFVG